MRTTTSKKHGLDVAVANVRVCKRNAEGRYHVSANVSVGDYEGNYDSDIAYFFDSGEFQYDGETTNEEMYNNRENLDYLVENLDADDVVDYYLENRDNEDFFS